MTSTQPNPELERSSEDALSESPSPIVASSQSQVERVIPGASQKNDVEVIEEIISPGVRANDRKPAWPYTLLDHAGMFTDSEPVVQIPKDYMERYLDYYDECAKRESLANCTTHENSAPASGRTSESSAKSDADGGEMADSDFSDDPHYTAHMDAQSQSSGPTAPRAD